MNELVEFLRRAGDWLGYPLFNLGDNAVSAFSILSAVLVLIAFLVFSKMLGRAIDRFTRDRPSFHPASIYALKQMLHYALIALGVLLALTSMGVDFSKLALVAGAIGVGIGLGLQGLVNNFVSGLILFFERSLKVGDYVELESGVTGEVREINFRSTLVTTNDNIDVVVPNSEFVNSRVTNWTMRETLRRFRIPFGVAYGTDKDLVRRVIVEAAKLVSYSKLDEEKRQPQVWLVEFGDSSLNFELLIWIGDADSIKRPGRITATYNWAIETALNANGIEIPFPQRDLHLRSGFDKAGLSVKSD